MLSIRSSSPKSYLRRNGYAIRDARLDNVTTNEYLVHKQTGYVIGVPHRRIVNSALDLSWLFYFRKCRASFLGKGFELEKNVRILE